MLRRQTGCECKLGQTRDDTFPFFLHFSRHLTRAGKVETLAQCYPPRCPLPEPLDLDWSKTWPVKQRKHFGTATWLEKTYRHFNTSGRKRPREDFFSDWLAQRRQSGSAWWGPDQQVRAGESRVQREGKNLLKTVEECQWPAGDLLSPSCPISRLPSPCCPWSRHWCYTYCRHRPPEVKAQGRRIECKRKKQYIKKKKGRKTEYDNSRF